MILVRETYVAGTWLDNNLAAAKELVAGAVLRAEIRPCATDDRRVVLLDEQGHPVGHVPENEAQRVRAALLQGRTVVARVRSAGIMLSRVWASIDLEVVS